MQHCRSAASIGAGSAAVSGGRFSHSAISSFRTGLKLSQVGAAKPEEALPLKTISVESCPPRMWAGRGLPGPASTGPTSFMFGLNGPGPTQPPSQLARCASPAACAPRALTRRSRTSCCSAQESVRGHSLIAEPARKPNEAQQLLTGITTGLTDPAEWPVCHLCTGLDWVDYTYSIDVCACLLPDNVYEWHARVTR